MRSVVGLKSRNYDNPIEFKNRIDGLYLKIPLNDLIIKVIEGIHKLKNADVDDYSHELMYEFTAEERIRAELVKSNFSTVDELKRAVSPSQIQLFVYLLQIWREYNGAEEFVLEAKDYFNHRGIAVRKGSKDRLERDLAILSSITLQVEVKQKKQRNFVDSSLMEYRKERSGYYLIRFGPWIESVAYRFFTLLHKGFFKFHLTHDWIAILLILKLTQLAKLQFRKALSSHSLKFHTLLSFLNISDKQISKQGYNYYLNQLDRATELLKTEGGYSITIDRQTNSYSAFKQNKLYYEQLDLKRFYQAK